MAVAQPQERHGREVRTGRVAANGQRAPSAGCRPPLLPREPQRSGLAVVGPCRVGILRRQAIAHADDRKASLAGEPVQPRVLHVVLAQRPSAAVYVQERPSGLLFGRDDAQGDGAAGPLDLERARLREEHRRGKDAAALAARLARLLG